MLAFSSLFAAAGPMDAGFGPAPIPNAPSNSLGVNLREILLIAGVGVVLGLILFIWAYLSHKRRRQHHSRDRLSKVITKAEKLTPEQLASKRVKIKRRRRGHPGNLPRNPTLGETGGLPPIRPDEPPAEAAPQ